MRWHSSGLFHLYPADHAAFLRMLVKWLALGSAVGVLSGTASAIFLTALGWATQFRLDNSPIILLLPLAGFIIGWVYHRFGSTAGRGNNLIIETVTASELEAASRIPLRMAPLVLAGTVLTHLFGGSAGREGTAIQMGGSLADGLRRLLRLNWDDRRLLLMAGISGGFGSVFGTPLAGFIFGMEVQNIGRIRYEGIIPCLTAAIVGDLVTRAWGAAHSHYPHLAETALDLPLLLKVIAAGILFGLTSLVFIELTHAVKALSKRLIAYPPLQTFAGGIILLLVVLAGTQDYLGLSLPLIQASLEGAGVVALAFLLKLIFTAVTLGTGFVGGEVTPLFVIGSTLGYTLGRLLGVDPAFMAALGFVAVFAGASNTPLACALMGIELFGSGGAIYLALACFVAYLASGHRGIYVSQIIDTAKTPSPHVNGDERLADYTSRRQNGNSG